MRQQQQRQRQQQPIKQNVKETESVNVSVKDDGGRSLVPHLGGKKKGKEKNNKEKEEEEEVKEREIWANGERNKGVDERACERHVSVGNVVKGEKEDVVLLRSWRKRGTRLVFRPKARGLVEGSECGVEIGWKLDNVGEERGWQAKVERNAGNEKAAIGCEEDGLVEKSGEVERKVGGVLLELGNDLRGEMGFVVILDVGLRVMEVKMENKEEANGGLIEDIGGIVDIISETIVEMCIILEGMVGLVGAGMGKEAMVWVKKAEAVVSGDVCCSSKVVMKEWE